MTALRNFQAIHVASMIVRFWPLCKALHNGHYVKFPFMHSTLVFNG